MPRKKTERHVSRVTNIGWDTRNVNVQFELHDDPGRVINLTLPEAAIDRLIHRLVDARNAQINSYL